MKKILIGGYALVKLGSSRHTEDIDYLVNDSSTTDMFIHDHQNNIDYVNANGHEFYREIWEMEKNNVGEIASPQSLLELKAFAWIQYLQNGHWDKANAAEFDMKFLANKYNLEDVKILPKHIHTGELSEVRKIINAYR